MTSTVQIETVQQDLAASVKLRQCTECQLRSAECRAEKAEAHLAQVHQGGVDMNLQVIKLQAECAHLRQDNDAMRTEQLSSKHSASEQQGAVQTLTTQCSEQAERVKSMEAQVVRLEEQRRQLQEQSDKDRASAMQANDVSANLDRLHKSLQKQSEDDKAYAEARAHLASPAVYCTQGPDEGWRALV